MFLRPVDPEHITRREDVSYCYIRANLVEGSFRLEMGPLTQWNRRFFRQFKGILEGSQKGGAGNRREFISKRRN
jgi:hypothetical protein